MRLGLGVMLWKKGRCIDKHNNQGCITSKQGQSTVGEAMFKLFPRRMAIEVASFSLTVAFIVVGTVATYS